jgi:hypothetical protein
MGRPLKTKKTTTTDVGFNAWDQLTAAVVPSDFDTTQFTNVVGGNDGVASATYPVVKCRVYISGASEADGWIIRQKGSTKYLVTDGTNTGVCTLADEADTTLTEGNMNITMSVGDSAATTIARLTNRWALDYSNNRYAINFFTDGGTEIKSGAADNATVTLAVIENYTS